MTYSVGPGELVRHMQNPSYAYDRLSPSYARVYVIALGTSFDIYRKVKQQKNVPGWTFIIHVFVS